MPGFVSPYASAVTGNRLRPFPSAPLRTGLDTFTSSGSPVALSFDWFLLILVCPRRSSGVDRDVASLADDEGLAPSVSATFSVDGEERLGSLHFASLHVPAIGSPTPLCQVSGFPGLELLWGFRRPGARAGGDLRFLHNLTSEHGLGPPFIPTPGLDRPVSHRAGLP